MDDERGELLLHAAKPMEHSVTYPVRRVLCPLDCKADHFAANSIVCADESNDIV